MSPCSHMVLITYVFFLLFPICQMYITPLVFSGCMIWLLISFKIYLKIFPKIFILFLITSMGMSLCGYVHECSVQGGQKRVLYLPRAGVTNNCELPVLWVLWTELRSSARSASSVSTLKHLLNPQTPPLSCSLVLSHILTSSLIPFLPENIFLIILWFQTCFLVQNMVCFCKCLICNLHVLFVVG